MKKFKRYYQEAFVSQFSFLFHGENPVANGWLVEEVRVSRVDEALLEKTPMYDGATGSRVGIDDNEKIFLFDKEGNLLTEVEQAGYCRHNESHCDDEEWDGEAVGEALLRVDAKDVYYVVTVHTGYRIRDHHSVGGYSVTLYKPPKGFSLPEWVKERRRRAAQAISAEIAEIDAEAQQGCVSR